CGPAAGWRSRSTPARTWTSGSRTLSCCPARRPGPPPVKSAGGAASTPNLLNPREALMTTQDHPNRRRFLTTAAATLAVPTILPRSVFGANEKVVTGHVGVRNQGTPNLKAFLKRAAPAAVCDVDRDVLAKAVKLLEDGGVSKPAAFKDYRELLDRKDVDPVVITTPDHWHALITVHACQAGKDVYCEKPLSLTVAEGRRMVAAARRYDRVVQTGSQQRSDARFRRACELVRSGKIGP